MTLLQKKKKSSINTRTNSLKDLYLEKRFK